MADNELSAILNRRQNINDALDDGKEIEPHLVKVKKNIYAEFSEFSRKEIKDYENKFKGYNSSGNGKLSLEELKIMMEKLGAPQTHLGLKAMIKEVDEDEDGAISFREFLLIFRKSAAGELNTDSGLEVLVAKQNEIDVDEVGVNGAKNFFESKIAAIRKTSKFEDEIREEQEERKRSEEDKRQRQQSFKERAAIFGK